MDFTLMLAFSSSEDDRDLSGFLSGTSGLAATSKDSSSCIRRNVLERVSTSFSPPFFHSTLNGRPSMCEGIDAPSKSRMVGAISIISHSFNFDSALIPGPFRNAKPSE